MKAKFLIVFLTTLIVDSSVIIAQTPAIQWQKTYGGSGNDWGQCIRQTSDGGYIMTGETTSNDGEVSGNHGDLDCWIVKLSATGAIEWEKTYGGSLAEYTKDIKQTPDGGYIFLGETSSNDGNVSGWHAGSQTGQPSSDIWVLKLSSSGAIQWSKCYGGSKDENPGEIILTNDGGYAITGSTWSPDGDVTGYHFDQPFGSNYSDMWIIKITNNGTIQWEKAYGSNFIEMGASLVQTIDGGFAVTSRTNCNGVPDGDVSGAHNPQFGGLALDVWVVKLDNAGLIQWQRCYGGIHDDYPHSIKALPTGEFVVGASAFSSDGDITDGHTSGEYWILKLASDGNIIWSHCHGGFNSEDAADLQLAPDGGFFMTGRSDSWDGECTNNYGTFDYWVIKMNSLGGLEWQKSLGGSAWEQAESVTATNDGYCIVTGITSSHDYDISTYHGGGDIWIVKLGPPCLSNLQITGPALPFCTGNAQTFNVSLTNPPINPTYHWELNGITIGGNSPTISGSLFNDNDTLVCVANTDASCALNPNLVYDTLILHTQAPVIPTISITTSGNNICANTSITFTATTTFEGTAPVYQWQKNGVNVGINSSTYTDNALLNGDIIKCLLTSNYNCVTANNATSNSITMIVVNTVTPTLSISAGNNSICQGDNVIFTASFSNEGTAPVFQWKKNGSNVGSNTTTYSDNTLVNGDIISCTLTSNAGCATSNTINSNNITMQVNGITNPTIAIAADNNNICAGTNVTFTASFTNGGSNPIFQWKKNGINVGSNTLTYSDNSIVNGDIIACVLTSNSACATTPTAVSNNLTMVVNNVVIPGITISTNSINVCQNSLVIFNAVFQNTGTAPAFQWKKNGVNVGTNTSVYQDNSLANSDQIQCIVTSNQPCAFPTTATSNIITMNVAANATPAISISASNLTICPGENVLFNTTIINGGSNPIYQWKKNGINAGTNAATYSDNTLVNNDQVLCILTTNIACATAASVQSNILTINTINLSAPAINITSDVNNVCTGTTINFNATVVNPGTTLNYQWKKNGSNIGSNSSSYSDNSINNGDIISCSLTSVNQCGTSFISASNDISCIIKPLVVPQITISSSDIAFCPGKTVTLGASIQNGGNAPIYEWHVNGIPNGQQLNSFQASNFHNNDIVYCLLQSTEACAVPATAQSNSIQLTVRNIPLPLSLGKDSFICNNYKSAVLLTPSPVYSNMTWQDGSHTPSYEALQEGNYFVTAYDNNGCYGSDTVKINSRKCNEGFFIPSAFTPNDDLLNSNFKPTILGNLAKYELYIYNRWGQLVFYTNDINYGWDGKYKGRKQDTQSYIWVCSYQFFGKPLVKLKGYFTLIK